MKRLDEQLSFTLFDVNKAHCTESDSAAGIKGMNQFVFALAGLQLIVEHPEHVGRNMFEFELSVVGHSLLAIDLLNAFTL